MFGFGRKRVTKRIDSIIAAYNLLDTAYKNDNWEMADAILIAIQPEVKWMYSETGWSRREIVMCFAADGTSKLLCNNAYFEEFWAEYMKYRPDLAEPCAVAEGC